MRFLQYGVLVLLIVGLITMLAFGFGTDSGNVDDNTALIAGSEYLNDAPEPDPVLSAMVDFGSNGEYVLDPATLRIKDGTLSVYTSGGSAHLASFVLDSKGMMVPAKGQPGGNVVKSAYSGPPGDTYSLYRVYGSEFSTDKSSPALIAIDYNGGNVSVTPGSEIVRAHAKSVTTMGDGYGNSVASSCGTSGGGGG